MFRLGWLLLGATCLLVATGCGANPDSLAKQRIEETNKLADALEAGKSESEIETIGERIEKVDEQIDNLSDDQKKDIAEKHGAELAKATGRVTTALMKKVGQNMGDLIKGMKDSMPPMPSGF